MINGLLSAVRFLTVLPVFPQRGIHAKISHATVYFPLVGLFLGAALYAINVVCDVMAFPALLTAVVLVIFLAAATGALHLDGLADTADAFLSGKAKDEMLTVMRDPHIGTMGVVALISVIAFKIALLYSITGPLKLAAFVTMCVAGRWAAVYAMFLFPYARVYGKAQELIKGMNAKIFIVATVLACVCVGMAAGLRGLATLAVVGGFTYISGNFVRRKIGGITGDTLGALVESSEVLALFALYIGGGN